MDQETWAIWKKHLDLSMKMFQKNVNVPMRVSSQENIKLFQESVHQALSPFFEFDVEQSDAYWEPQLFTKMVNTKL